MKENLRDTAISLRKKGDYEYVLSNYVNRQLWLDKFSISFPKWNVENLTDFNYATCFTICVNLDDTDVHVGSQRFNDYLKRNVYLFRIQVQISAIAPYAILKYQKYYVDNDMIMMSENFAPFEETHTRFANFIIDTLHRNNIEMLDEDSLSTVVDDIKLELKESNVTIYNCLFEDSYL